MCPFCPLLHHCLLMLLLLLLKHNRNLLLQVRAFKEDPLIFHGDLRVATGNELLRVGA
jgi:hypothetical protein